MGNAPAWAWVVMAVLASAVIGLVFFAWAFARLADGLFGGFLDGISGGWHSATKRYQKEEKTKKRRAWRRRWFGWLAGDEPDDNKRGG